MRTYILTTAEVNRAAALLQDPCPHCGHVYTVQEVANMFNITRSTASRIHTGIITEGYDAVPPPPPSTPYSLRKVLNP